MNNIALATTRTEELMFMPVMDMEVAISRRNYVVEFTKRIMVEGTDYGKIPGTGDKPTLLKPGAEKLTTFFGLTPVFIAVAVEEDWTGAEHKGEPFFYYRYRCELHRNGQLIATSEGSCNTWESKYRYRKGERVCPSCGQPAIIKGKKEYGGGWVCFKKKGGCDAKFSDGDASIEAQEVGRINNPDSADVVNTVQKMAQKRALVAATLLAVNASEFYTQDIEDMAIDAEWTTVSEPEPKAKPKQGKGKQTSANDDVSSEHGEPMNNPFNDPSFADEQPSRPVASQARLNLMHKRGVEYYGTNEKWDAARPKWVENASTGQVTSSGELMPKECEWIIERLEKRINDLAAKEAATEAVATETQPELQPA